MAIALSGLGVLLAYRLPFFSPDLLGVVQFIGVVVFSGFASASVTLVLQYMFAQTLGITTALQLLDISHPQLASSSVLPAQCTG